MYREILPDFSSSSFLLYIYQMPFLYVFIYWPNILDFYVFVLVLVSSRFFAPSVSFSDEGLEF